ncbi:hypothetical protein JRQ81_017273 [Phrynocephalus forsythii]|uniref:G-protein coupled receptors family 1 profile domain-containing protein n=1 Tax=Phrynocephalus forsythii TaxID=171643 RepID=A0A9Q1AZT3_9SAUR|nr:hypothetical protein JRQ81_017273 [Phrynocephalus forsythii]
MDMKTASASNISNASADSTATDNIYLTASAAFSQPGWQIAIWAIVYLTMVVVSIVGNSTVIWIILFHRRMRTVTNYFIVNLALSDLLMTALNTVFNFIYASHNVWYFSEGFCRFLNLLPITAVFVSIYSMTAVAAERYMAIVFPFKRKLSAANTKVIIGIIWLVAAGLAFPQFFYAQIIFHDETPKCTIAWPGDSERKRLTYHITVIVLVYLLPLTVMFITYSAIAMALWNNAVPGDHTNKIYYQHQIMAKKKFVRTMVAVVITFAICWLPYHLYFILGSIWKDINQQKYIQQVYLAVFLLAMSSAMYSPIIYCCLNQRFRSGFRMAFQWCPCIKATEQDKRNLTHPSPLQNLQRDQTSNLQTSSGTHTTNDKTSFTNICLVV